MSKRDRHLKQRLDELFSSSAEPAETQPPAEQLAAEPSQAAVSIESTAAASADLSYLISAIARLPLPAYLKDREHTWVAVNPAFAQLIGYTPEALLGHSDKEQADDAWQLDDRVLDGKHEGDSEETTSLPDGTIRTRHTRRTLLFAAGQQARFVMGVVEETLAAGSHGQTPTGDDAFHAAMSAMANPVIISRIADDVILYANEAFSAFTAVPPAQLAGQQTIRFYADPQDREHVAQSVRQHGELHGFEVRMRRADGSELWVSLSIRRLLFNDERCVITTLEDLSYRKQSEKALLARNKQLAAFNRLGQELAQLVTVQAVMEHVYHAIGAVFDNRNLYIALYDDRKQEITFPIYTIDGQRRTVTGRSFDNGLTEYVLQTRKTLLIPRNVQQFIAISGIASIGRASQCYLGIPLISGDKAIGLVAVQDYDREDVYSTEDVELLSAIATQTAAALDNVRLYAVEARRAMQLQTTAEISTAAATVLSVDELLPFVVNLIQQRFNLYYVGLFLIDDGRRNAVLRAGTGEAGRIMLNRGHQLPLDEHSMIGWCIQHQTARIALDVGEDAVHFNNPALPDTRSELALPLVSRGQVMGGMSVQSTEAAAFSEQDVAILQTMSDQVATSIANAQLFEQASRAGQQAEARLRETLFLQRVGQAVSASLDLSNVMDIVMDTLEHELGFTHNALHLLHKQTGTVSIPRASGTAAQLRGLTRSIEQLQDDITMDILRKGELEVIDGWDDRFDREIFESQGHAALVRAFVPLRLRGESIGLLEVGYWRAKRARITPDEVRLLGGLADQIAIAVGNAQLFKDSQQRITELAVVNEIGRTLTVTQDAQQLFATIHQQVGRLFDASDFYIATYDGGDEWSLDYQIEHGQLLPPQRHKLGGGLTSHILQTRRPILIRSQQENLMFHDQQNLPQIGETAKSWMGVPLIVGGGVIGVMGIQSYAHERLYTEQDVTLFSTIGTQAAAAVQNAHLFQEARLRASELAALNDLSQTLAAQLNVQQVLREIWQGVSRLLDTTNFYIALYDRERAEVTFPINVSESALDKEIEVLPASQGLTGYIIRTRQPLLITEDTSKRVAELGLENVGGNSQSYLGVPLILGEQVLGVMAIQSYTRARLYHEHDKDFLTAIANQAAIALQNARLFERTQQSAHELATLNELGQAVSQLIEIDEVLEVAYQWLRRLVSVDAFFAVLYDQESNTISLPVIYDEGKRYAEPSFPFNPNSRTGQVILTGKPVLALVSPAELAAMPEIAGALGNVNKPSASLLYVPLQVGARTIGALSIQSYKVSAYNQDTVQLMSNVAIQVAIAIQNARLFNESRQRSVELATLNQIISSTTQTLDPRTLLDTVLKQTLEVFGFDGGLITIFNDSRQKLERIVRTGLPGNIPDDPAEGLENSLCAYVFNSAEPLVIEDFRQSAPIDVSGEIAAGYLSYIGIPLEARGRKLGTWCGFRKTAGPFGRNTLTLLQAVSGQLSSAIENAYLFNEAQARARHEQILREITSRVRNSTDSDAIARTAIRELGLALGRQTFIRLGDAEQLGRPPQASNAAPAPGNGHNAGLEGGQ